MMLPFIGRLPVNSQIRAINFLSQFLSFEPRRIAAGRLVASIIPKQFVSTGDAAKLHLAFVAGCRCLWRMKFKCVGQNSLAALFLAVGFLTTFFPNRSPAQSEKATGQAGSAETNIVANSVVKIFSTMRYPDPYKPWTKQAPTEVTGSGVVIKGKRILTNAHVVLYASQVQVQANQSGNLVSATVEAVAPGIDLAVLKLDDDSFFDSHSPLEWASSPPEVQDPVMVYGYPLGGANLSITKGIVSRIEFAAYNYPMAGLRIQIDAAINPGNSGGPAVVGDKMIGIAFSRLTGNTQNIGYIIPCEEISLFLNNIAGGSYTGKPLMFDECQVLGNPALYSFLKLDASVKGIIVSQPDLTNQDYPLKKWDVITKIGDTPVDDQGMVNLDNNLRVFFKYLVQKITTNGVVPLTVMRGGKEMQIELPVSSDHPRLIPDLNGGYPSYFVYGPLVFSDATGEFMSGLTTGNFGSARMSLLGISGSPLMTRMGSKPAFDQESLVVVCSPLFPHKLSRGYANPFGEVVKTVNDIPIKNLGHLVEILRDSKDKFITIEFYGHLAPILVFPRAEIIAATDPILTDNDIRSQGSPDTMAVWNAKNSR
jgi:S1-C subfamily serine protease